MPNYIQQAILARLDTNGETSSLFDLILSDIASHTTGNRTVLQLYLNSY